MGEVGLEATLKKLLDEIVITRKDLRNAIEASESRLLLEIESVNLKIRKLETENKDLKNKIEKLKRNQKKNGIVIHGIKIHKELTIEFICSQIKSLLQVDVTPNQISDFYTLGQNETSPIKIELVHNWKKREILKNTYKLKGTKIYFSSDLTKEQLENLKTLRKHLKLAKEDNQENCYIKGGNLHVNGITYTAEELREVEANREQKKLDKGPNSAPSTPTPTEVPQNELDKVETFIARNIKDNIFTDTPTSSKPQPKNNTPTANKQATRPLTRLQENKYRNNSNSRK